MSANHDGKPFDVAVYGASGYTGRLVAEYLSQRQAADSGISFAMAGRNLDKLAAVREEIGAPADTPLVEADAEDAESLASLCSRSKVVLTTVGPYQLYGSDLVRICAETGTDYVDLCGEPAWMRLMIDAHEATARKSGARILFSCGFDSIPFDLGVLFLQQHARDRFGEPLSDVETVVRKMKGTFSGGTAASLKATMAAAFKDPTILEHLKNPFALAPGFSGAKQPSGSKPMHHDGLGVWLAPFVMAPINTKNVHRTNFLLDAAYGKGFTYREMLMTGPGEKGEAAARALASDTSLMSDDGPKPGEGPTREEREAGHYEALIIGRNDSGKELRISVSGDRDPGYGSTSKMIAEAALTLVHERADAGGGIWTPGAALGEALIDRLTRHAGLSFALVDS
ncbi:MAG: saccharopine dehydrogenase [Alphaproteobacteria bacterium]|nr:saccharopine dehydrogenase [Alphaproteobacteria bacterium]